MFKNINKNKLILAFSLFISVFGVIVGGVSTFAWFRAATSPEVSNSAVQSGSNDLTIDGITGYKYIYDDTGGGIDYESGHVSSYGAYGTTNENISQDSLSPNRDVPSGGVGFYIKGDDTFANTYGDGKTAWTYASSLRMEDKYGKNYAYYEGLEVEVDEEIKIWHHYFLDETNPKDSSVNRHNNSIYIVSTGTSSLDTSTYYEVTNEYKNIKFNTAGVYNIWVINDNGTPKISLEFDGTVAPISPSIKRASNPSPGSGKNSIKTKIYYDRYSISSDRDYTYPCIYFYTSSKSQIGNRVGMARIDDNYWYYEATIPSNTYYFKIQLVWDSGNTRGTNNDYYTISSYSGKCVTFGSWGSNGNFTNSSKDYYPDGWYIVGSLGSSWSVTQGIFLNGELSDGNIAQLTNIKLDENTSFCLVKSYNNGGNLDRTNAKRWASINGTDKTTYSSVIADAGDGDHNIKIINQDLIFNIFLNSSGTIFITVDTFQITYSYVVVNADGSYISGPTKYKNSTSIYNGNTFSAPQAPQSNDYTVLTYWHEGYNSSTNTFGTIYSARVLTSSIDLYAKFKIKPITIHTRNIYLGLKNGNADVTSTLVEDRDAVVDYTDVYAGLTYSGITTPSSKANGYEFKGWYTSETGGTKIGDNLTSYTSWTNGTTYYARYIPAGPHSISFSQKCFSSSSSTVEVSGTSGSAIASESAFEHANFVPSNTINSINKLKKYRHKIVQSNYEWEVYLWDGYYYTDPTCETKYNGTKYTTNSTLYLRYNKMPSEVLYFQDGLQNESENLSQTYPDAASLKYNSGAQIFANLWINDNGTDIKSNNWTSSSTTTADGSLEAKHNWYRYYQITIPVGARVIFNNGFWTENNNYNQTVDIFTSDTDTTSRPSESLAPTRGDLNMVSAWRRNVSGDRDNGKVKYSWARYPGNPNSDGYYIVGDSEFTKNVEDSWTFNSVKEMETVDNDSTPGDYEIIAKANSVNLEENMSFQVWKYISSTGNVIHYNGTNLATNSVDGGDTLLYVYNDSDSNNNIKVSPSVTGKFNVLLVRQKSNNSNIFVQIEDANKAGYLFFTNVTGEESSNYFRMGSGDGSHNLVVYEAGIRVRAGDTFLLRNRYKGRYTYYGYADIYSSHNYIKQSSTQIPENTLGGTNDTTGDTNKNPEAIYGIEFVTSGTYSIYLTSSGKVVVKSVEGDSYGYFIAPNPNGDSDVEGLAGSPNAFKMRQLKGSNKNIAVYSGLHVTDENGTKLSFFSQFKEYRYEDGDDTYNTWVTAYRNFYDGVYAKDNSQSAFDETEGSETALYYGDYITLKKGYYDIYLYNDGGTKRISITNASTADFFAMNSIPLDRNSENGVFNSNTTLIVRVDFTCTNINDVDVFADINLTNNGNGLHNYIKYAFILDPSIPTNKNAYDYLRENNYSNLDDYSQSNSLTTLAGSSSSSSHTLYIMMDYDPDEVTNLVTSSNLINDFYFVLRTSQ